MSSYIYQFAPGPASGNPAVGDARGVEAAEMAEMAEMAKLGLAVPPGMTVAAAACRYYLRRRRLPEELYPQMIQAIEAIEAATGRRFGSPEAPLLLSLRGGSPLASSPTTKSVLNLGLNEETVAGFSEFTGDERFAYDCLRRLIQDYAALVFGVSRTTLSAPVEAALSRADVDEESQLSAGDWKDVIAELRRQILEQTGRQIPSRPMDQLMTALAALFEGWSAAQTQSHRRLPGRSASQGMAANIMAMVFGNIDEESGSGVAYSRNPASGARGDYGEFLPRAHAEEVVAGLRRPRPLRMARRARGEAPSLQESNPEVYRALRAQFLRLEQHYRDMVEIDFTVEAGRLWILRVRRGTRSGEAAVRIALDMMDEGLIDSEEVVLRVDPGRHISELLSPRIDPSRPASTALITRGIPASPGAARGRLVTGGAEAIARSRRGESVVLVRPAGELDDLEGVAAALGVITADGGRTSQVALMSRELGIPCVTGARGLSIAPDGSGIILGEQFIARGEYITVDGTGGALYVGELPLVSGAADERFQRFMQICDRHRRMEIRVNADNAEAARRGVMMGADGVGLCRTERIFGANEERLLAMQRALLAGEEDEGARPLQELLRVHRQEVAQILRALEGAALTIQLLDSPLGRFLPRTEAEALHTAQALELEVEEVVRRVAALQESNPMMGLRGCRLAIVHPAVYAMQVQAVIEACRTVIDDGIRPVVEFLIPLVSDAEELRWVVEHIDRTIAEHIHGAHGAMSIEIGAMIEVPRAALQADAIAAQVDFICLGTTDLTQYAWAMAREETGRFMTPYLEGHLLGQDPFEILDRRGVGELMRIATHRGRRENNQLFVGVCGAHAHEASSVRFFESLDMDYLSVDPEEVFRARLAAARAYVAQERTLAAGLRP